MRHKMPTAAVRRHWSQQFEHLQKNADKYATFTTLWQAEQWDHNLLDHGFILLSGHTCEVAGKGEEDSLQLAQAVNHVS